MKKSIVISFVKTKLFPPEVPMHSVFTVREDTMGRQLSDLLELHFIELGKIDWKGREPEELSPLEQLGAYMRCSGEEREAGFVEALVRKGEKVITMADTVLRKISEEERLQNIEEDKRIAEIFRRMELAHSREKALKEGREEGLKEGLLTSITNLIESMGWTPEQAMDALKIPERDRAAYAGKLKQEPTGRSEKELL